MAEHKHGTMNTKVQEQTFAGFISFSKWVIGITIAVLIFTALVNA